MVARETLANLGSDILLASDGEEAVRVFQANRDPVDLLLLDVVLAEDQRAGGLRADQRQKGRRAGDFCDGVQSRNGTAAQRTGARFDDPAEA